MLFIISGNQMYIYTLSLTNSQQKQTITKLQIPFIFYIYIYYMPNIQSVASSVTNHTLSQNLIFQYIIIQYILVIIFCSYLIFYYIMSEDKILNSVPIKKFKKKVFNWAQSQTQRQNKENSYNLLNPSTVITKTNSTHEDNNKFMIDQKFALSLLKYEMELECVNSISNELHMKLLDLYEHGKEFYKLKKDKRQVYFNKKIKSLQKLMQNSSRSPQMQIKSIDKTKKNQFERLIQFTYVEVDQKIYDIIKSAEVMQQFEKLNKKKIEENLKKQNQTIKKRIQKRKQSLKALSNITNNITEESETQKLINSNLKSRGIVSLGNSRIQQYHDI